MVYTLALLPLALLALGTPIFLIFLSAVTVTFALVLPIKPIALHQTVFGGLDNYALLAVPFFVFAGELMGGSGIARRLVNWVLALTGRVPGSLGVATVGGAAIMGVISGSSVAAVATLGKTLYPRLVKAGYGEARSAGLLASSGAIDIIIPPSIAMILYGFAAEQSVPRLFIAGILPGILIAVLMSGYMIVTAMRLGIPRSDGVNFAHVWQSSKEAAAALMIPVLVLGGIYGGFFSPTEAGGFACLYSIIVARYIYRSMSWSDILRTAASSAMLSAQILILVATAGIMTWVLTTQGVPQAIIAWMEALNMTPVAFLLAVNLFLLVVGAFLDPTSAILVFAPLLAPIAMSLGIDPIHFGVVMTVNLAIGMFTPPFGMNIFVAQAVTGLPAHTVFRGVVLPILVQLIALIIITYVPALSLTLGQSL